MKTPRKATVASEPQPEPRSYARAEAERVFNWYARNARRQQVPVPDIGDDPAPCVGRSARGRSPHAR